MTAGSSLYAEALQRTLQRLIEINHGYLPAVLANGFGPESMVMTDLISKHGFNITIISLDTGRLPAETHALAQKIHTRYGPIVRMVSPDPEELEKWTLQHGPNAFYQSVQLRHECCHIRKVAPLRRVLAGQKAWLTGLRREQAHTRAQLGEHEWDAANGLHKFNPMIDWTTEQVWAYIREQAVPYNELHDKGYRSIGCAPCTRAIQPGEDQRAGRWWWENEQIKECGLHMDPATGRLERSMKSTQPDSGSTSRHTSAHTASDKLRQPPAATSPAAHASRKPVTGKGKES